jgi:hypothetical protein
VALMFWKHPSRRRLVSWAQDPDDPRIEAHVETCERCLWTVEQVETFEDIPLGDALRAFLSAPVDFEDHLVDRAEAARSTRAALEVLGGLAVIPWETLRVMIDKGGADNA